MRGIDLKKIAEKMGGASGAELKVISGPTLSCHALCSARNQESMSWVSAGILYLAGKHLCIVAFNILPSY